MPRTWAIQDAKARLSEVVERAQRGEVQVLTKHGKKTAVVLSFEDYARLTGVKRTLWEVLRPGPVFENDEIEQLFVRDRSVGKDVRFELDS